MNMLKKIFSTSIIVILLTGCEAQFDNQKNSNNNSIINKTSSALSHKPDAGTDGIDAVKSWAFERVIWAEGDFNSNGKHRYGSPDWWGNEIVYQIQVDRFNNGNTTNDNLNKPHNQPDDLSQGDLYGLENYRHGGDIKGIMDRMDYFVDLGITTLWVTPVLKHTSSYHGYCTSDFTYIDPGFGTNEEFRDMVSMAHSRNIKVVMDIVVNHMCDNNTSYTKWPDHYKCSDDLNDKNWKGTPGGSWDAGVLGFGDTFFPPFKRQEFFNRCGANSHGDMTGEGNASVYGDFVSTMFDFDTRNHDFQDIFSNLHKFWIAYADVDGFRMDAAKHITEDFIAHFNTTIRNYANSIGKHNFYIIGEVAGSADLIGRKLGKMFSNPYNPNERGTVPQTLTNRMWQMLERYGSYGNYWYGANSYMVHPVQNFPGLSAAYDFAHSGRARGALRNDSGINSINNHFTDGYFQTLNAQNDPRVNWNLLEIHDWPRFVEGKHKNNPWKSSLGMSYLSTAQGIPVIYYGQEQGFNGDCHWNNINAGYADNDIKGVCGGHDHSLYRQDMFISGPWKLGSTVENINNLAYIGHTKPFTWRDWTTDPYLDRNNSVYKSARKFNYIRRSCDALRYGVTYFRAGWNEWEDITAFSRIDGNKEILVIVNNSSNTIHLDKLPIDSGINNQSGHKYKNLLNGYQQAWTGFENNGAHLYFSHDHSISGNSVQVWVHESNISKWNNYLETHLCLN